MLERRRALRVLEAAFTRAPVVAILGPRQIGKTTLARQYADRMGGPVTSFDLEDPRDLSRLDDPPAALEGLRGLVVLDEIQRLPEVFPVLRVLVDRRGQSGPVPDPRFGRTPNCSASPRKPWPAASRCGSCPGWTSRRPAPTSCRGAGWRRVSAVLPRIE